MKISKKLAIDHIDRSHYICKSEMDEYRSAQKAVLDAEARVKTLCEQAQSDYEYEFSKAYEEGKRKACKELIKKKIMHSKRSIEHLMELEDDLVLLMEKAINKVLGEIGKTTLIKETINNLIKDIEIKNKITLRVNPKIEEDIKNIFFDELKKNHLINIAGDSRIPDSQSFILETPTGNIDSSIKKQVNEILSIIKESL